MLMPPVDALRRASRSAPTHPECRRREIVRASRRPAAISPRATPACSATRSRRRLLPRGAARRSEEQRTARPRLPLGARRRRHRRGGAARRAAAAVDSNRPHRAPGARRACAQAEAISGGAPESCAVGARPDHRSGRARCSRPGRCYGANDAKGAIEAIDKLQGAGLVRAVQGPARRPDPRPVRQQERSRQALRARLQARSHRRCAWSRPMAAGCRAMAARTKRSRSSPGLRQGAAAPSADRRGDGRRSSAASRLPPLVDDPAGRRRRSALRPRRLARPPRRRGSRPGLSAARALSRAESSAGAARRSPISTRR